MRIDGDRPVRKQIKIWVNENQAADIMAGGGIHGRTRNEADVFDKLKAEVGKQFKGFENARLREREVRDIVENQIKQMADFKEEGNDYTLASSSLLNTFHKESRQLQKHHDAWIDNFINTELNKKGITDFRYEYGYNLYNVAERDAEQKRQVSRKIQASKDRMGCPYPIDRCTYDFRYKAGCPGLRGEQYTECRIYQSITEQDAKKASQDKK